MGGTVVMLFSCSVLVHEAHSFHLTCLGMDDSD